MGYLIELFVYVLYYCECLAATILFLYRREKRDKFGARMSLAVIVGIVVVVLVAALYQVDIFAVTVLKYIVVLAPLFLLCRCYVVKFTEMLFSVIFSTIAQHWATLFVDVIFLFAPSLPFVLEKLIGVVFFATSLAAAYPIIIKQTAGEFDIDGLTVALLCMSVFAVELSVRLLGEKLDNIFYIATVKILEIIFGYLIFWVCLYIIKRSNKKAKKLVSEALLDHEREQFEILKRNADAMQSKLHDLKYIMRTVQLGNVNREAVEQLGEITRALENSYNTGNPMLDIILSDAASMFASKSIAFSCVMDDVRTDFIDSFDLYSILGNAFDNAAEYLSTISEKEKRYVECSIRAVNSNLLCIGVSNYFERISDVYVGMTTTKADKAMHGFGLKNINSEVEKYGGVLSVTSEDNEFRLTATIPIQSLDKQ